jgi:hypothetical protein
VNLWTIGCADPRLTAPARSPMGRVRFSCRAARHLPIAARRAMIAPEAGLSVSRQCALLGIARSSTAPPGAGGCRRWDYR